MTQYRSGQKIMYYDRNTNNYKRGTVFTQPVNYNYGQKTFRNPVIVNGHGRLYTNEVNMRSMKTVQSNNIIDYNAYKRKLVSNTQLQKIKLKQLKNSIANISEIKNLPNDIRNKILEKINRKLVMVQNLRPFNK